MSSLKAFGPSFFEQELRVRPLVGRDAGDLFLLVDADRRVLRCWLPWVDAYRAVADASFYIQSLSGLWGTGVTFGIFERGALAGTVGLHHGVEHHQSVEVGYWLASKYWGRGLARRAIRLVLFAAFTDAGVHRVAARVGLDNERSQKVLKALGFKFEGIERQGFRFGDEWRDHEVYSLLASELSK